MVRLHKCSSFLLCEKEKRKRKREIDFARSSRLSKKRKHSYLERANETGTERLARLEKMRENDHLRLASETASEKWSRIERLRHWRYFDQMEKVNEKMGKLIKKEETGGPSYRIVRKVLHLKNMEKKEKEKAGREIC